MGRDTGAQKVLHMGEIKLVSLSGTAAATTLALQPAAGRRWLVLDAWGWHDDSGSNQTLQWRFYDGTTTLYKAASAAVAQSVHRNIRASGPSDNYVNTPIYLTYDKYAQLVAGGMSAGKKLYINALVLEWAY